jgi:pimeloyl-ACP methyl ester carboxylesterase
MKRCNPWAADIPRPVTEKQLFHVRAAAGDLGGWVRGSGTPVLLLHGGPGLSFDYLEGLAEEIGAGFRVAAFQQRGLAPSTSQGPFTMSQAIDDVLAALRHLGWTDALLVGHSWGGHLALRVGALHPDRVRAVVAVEPIGVVGDGGVAAFEAEMMARTPHADRSRMRELDDRAMAGQGTPQEALESMSLVWPAYFADPMRTMTEPKLEISIEAYSGLLVEMGLGAEQVAHELSRNKVRYSIVAGAGSPIPWGQAAQATAELSALGSLTVIAGAGHFPWFEAPGCVRGKLMRLTT